MRAPTKKQGDRYSDAEAKQRVEAAPRGALQTPHKPLKEKPKVKAEKKQRKSRASEVHCGGLRSFLLADYSRWFWLGRIFQCDNRKGALHLFGAFKPYAPSRHCPVSVFANLGYSHSRSACNNLYRIARFKIGHQSPPLT
jgi:hypothetical protein